MRELTNMEIKNIDLQLLKDIDYICRKNNIRYSITYGTLLGAVRHKGFIPWDDDIDLFMPRPDYNKFIEYCTHNETRFGFAFCEINPNYHKLYGKVWDLNTTIVDPYQDYKYINMGVNIDIMPLDGMGATINEAKITAKKAIARNKIMSAINWSHFHKSITNPWYYEPIRFILYILTRFINKEYYTKKANKKIQYADFQKSKYVGALCDAKTFRVIKNKELFSGYCELPFEDGLFYAMDGYKKFLEEIYGDYMKLPPIDKRVSNHDVKAYYI